MEDKVQGDLRFPLYSIRVIRGLFDFQGPRIHPPFCSPTRVALAGIGHKTPTGEKRVQEHRVTL
jgi:hypothetical protein